MDFSTIDFEQLQAFAYPLIKALGGPDIVEEISEKADVLQASGDLLSDAAAVMYAGAQALEDGMLTSEELNKVVGLAEDLPDALYAIQGAWYDEVEDGDSED